MNLRNSIDAFVKHATEKFGSTKAALDLLAEEGEAEARFVKRLRYTASVVEGSRFDADTIALRMIVFGAMKLGEVE